MNRRRRQLLILAAIIVVVAAAAVMLAGPAPADTASPDARSPSGPTPSTLEWGACPEGGSPLLPKSSGDTGIQCAELEVPVDPEHPDRRQITLVVGRLPAHGDAPPEGSLLVNFGGPGPSGIDLLQADPGPFAELRQRMDIVTWDPRGYGGVFGGRSTALGCDWAGMVRPQSPPYPRDQAEFDRLAAGNHALAQPCRDTDPALFDHMDSASHAHDIDAIRAALGEPRLDYYGASYGGTFGQAYARLFPKRVRTMVLDGTGNHATGDWDGELDAIARDNEAVFQRFLDWCAADAACVLHGSDAERRWQKLVARAEDTPIPAPAVDAHYTGRDLRMLGLGIAGRDREQWAGLAQAIADAERGDASGFAPRTPNPYPQVGTPGVTECLDFPRYDDHADMAATVERIRALAPNTGAAFPLVAHMTTCSGWPAPVTSPPAPLPAGLPPLLGAGTWTDGPGTSRAVDQVPGSSMITHDGPGHVLYASGNACVIEPVNRYILEEVVPPGGTEC